MTRHAQRTKQKEKADKAQQTKTAHCRPNGLLQEPKTLGEPTLKPAHHPYDMSFRHSQNNFEPVKVSEPVRNTKTNPTSPNMSQDVAYGPSTGGMAANTPRRGANCTNAQTNEWIRRKQQEAEKGTLILMSELRRLLYKITRSRGPNQISY